MSAEQLLNDQIHDNTGNWVIDITKGDGDCFFTAVANALETGKQSQRKTVEQLRQIAFDSLFVKSKKSDQLFDNQKREKIKKYIVDNFQDSINKNTLNDGKVQIALQMGYDINYYLTLDSETNWSDDIVTKLRELFITTSLIWADEVAIASVEKTLKSSNKIKFIIISIDNGQLVIRPIEHFYAGVSNSGEDVPNEFIFLYFTGNHYDLITFRKSDSEEQIKLFSCARSRNVVQSPYSRSGGCNIPLSMLTFMNNQMNYDGHIDYNWFIPFYNRAIGKMQGYYASLPRSKSKDVFAKVTPISISSVSGNGSRGFSESLTSTTCKLFSNNDNTHVLKEEAFKKAIQKKSRNKKNATATNPKRTTGGGKHAHARITRKKRRPHRAQFLSV